MMPEQQGVTPTLPSPPFYIPPHQPVPHFSTISTNEEDVERDKVLPMSLYSYQGYIPYQGLNPNP